MNFSVHLDSEVVGQLAQAVQRTGLTRNRIIALAVRDWLANNAEKDWPESLREHFRNPAPELAQESVDAQAWRAALTPDVPPAWQ